MKQQKKRQLSSLFIQNGVKRVKLTSCAILLACCFSVSATDSVMLNTDVDTLAESANTADSELNVISLLSAMKDAVLQTDYQVYFLVKSAGQSSPNTFKYQHINRDDKNSANLLSLEGSAREIILHNNIISYFQFDSAPFSITGAYILEAFPEIIYNDFTKLDQYYDFVLLGKSRTANRSSQLVRIVPKDKDRFSYLVWIDDSTHLPLRVDLLDLNSKMIEQMKVVELKSNFNKQQFEEYIDDRDYPTLFPNEKEDSELNNWVVSWLPNGFTESAAYNIYYDTFNIDTQLFSDGIFSFTVSVSAKSTEKTPHVITQGATTIYSANVSNMNVVVIGNLPAETIEKIAQSVKLK